MALVRLGGGALPGAAEPLYVPWWWTYIAQMSERIRGIQEATAIDPEKLTAPKDLWLNREEELEAWYKDRERLRKNQAGLSDDA